MQIQQYRLDPDIAEQMADLKVSKVIEKMTQQLMFLPGAQTVLKEIRNL